MNTSLLAEELEPLNAQVEVIRGKIQSLEHEQRLAEAELDAFSADRQRFDALREACDALDKLKELGADELFWEGAPEVRDTAGYVERLREQANRFEDSIRDVLNKQKALETQINHHLNELDYLYDEVRDAYARDERRQDEFVLEREISPTPFRLLVMPWTKGGEAESRFRRSLLVALSLSLVLGYLIPLVNVPIPDRSEVVVEIPERLAMLVKKEPPKPEPVPERKVEEKKPEEDKPEKPEKVAEKEKPKKETKQEKKPTKVADSGAKKARKKAENVGVLAFKSSFADLIDETPVAKLGVESRLNKKAPQAAGQARAQRSLVALQGRGSSGGISNAAVSRNLGMGGAGGAGNGDGIGKIGIARVESAVADLAEEARPLSDGPGPGRTDEEIQIVFDRYKATLYRIYNKELRKNPTLRGKMLMRIIIEASGEVSLCKVESTDLASPELVTMIVDRVKRFNFGPKDDVPPTEILYPIDFLPAS